MDSRYTRGGIGGAATAGRQDQRIDEGEAKQTLGVVVLVVVTTRPTTSGAQRGWWQRVLSKQ